jgi:hypothetical protein
MVETQPFRLDCIIRLPFWVIQITAKNGAGSNFRQGLYKHAE